MQTLKKAYTVLKTLLEFSSFLLIAILFGCASHQTKNVRRVEAIAREEYYNAKEECRGGRFEFVGEQLEQVQSYGDCMREKGWRAR